MVAAAKSTETAFVDQAEERNMESTSSLTTTKVASSLDGQDQAHSNTIVEEAKSLPETDDTTNSLNNDADKAEKKIPSRPASDDEDAHRGPHKFLTDEEISQSLVYRLMKAAFYTYLWGPFHNYNYQGLEHVPRNSGALFVGTHSTHNYDIIATMFATQDATGRVCRGLFHRSLFKWLPGLRYLGGVAGYRSTAKGLLEQGLCVGVLPGGAEEALKGHENSYNLEWKNWRGIERKGFAAVMLDLEKPCPIIPVFTKNQEEAKFNPIFFLWHHLRLSVLFYSLLNWLETNGHHTLGVWAWHAGLTVWWHLSVWCSIPIPVQATVVYGEPIWPKPGHETPAELKERTRVALQALIDANQPSRGTNYLPAIAERITSRRDQISLLKVLAPFLCVLVAILFWQFGFRVWTDAVHPKTITSWT